MKQPVSIVMLLSNSFRPDPRVLKEASGLQSAGYNVTLICWDREAELPQDEIHSSGFHIIRIHYVPSSYGIGTKQLFRVLRFWFALWPLLNKLKPAILHCHDFDTLPVGLGWGKLHNIPVIYDAHEYYADLCKPRLHGFLGWLIYYGIRLSELFCARLASTVITVDELLAQVYRKQNEHVTIIGHYPSINLFETAAPVFSRNILQMIYIGRLSQDRGTLIYIDVLRSLLHAGIEARLILAGTFTPSAESEILQTYMHDLEDQVEITGWIPYEGIPALLKCCDIGLAIFKPEPRYVNALPVKMFEYMAAGLPVVASRFPVISQVISTHDCGMLIGPNDSPEVIAGQILNWWKNPLLPMRLGNNGRLAVMNTYSWEALLLKLIKLYEGMSNSS